MGTKRVIFRHINGLYAADLLVGPAMVIDTVREREATVPKKALARLKGAIKLVETLGYPSDRDLITLIESGKVLNCPYTSKELIRAREVYGPSIGVLKGKTKREMNVAR